MGSAEDHRHGPRPEALGDRIGAFLVAQLDVENGGVQRLGLGQRQGLRQPRDRAHDLVAELAQQRAEVERDKQLVLDHKDAAMGGSRLGHCGRPKVARR